MIEVFSKLLFCWVPFKQIRRRLRAQWLRNQTKKSVENGKKKYYLLKDSLLESFCENNCLIKNNERFLVIAPHPDDEVLGCGGLMLKYSSQCDCICLSSSGFKRRYDTQTYQEISNERIREFHSVLDFIGVKNRWIFSVYGEIPHFEKIENLKDKYKEAIDFYSYDYIFLPDEEDSHREHQFITKSIVKDLIRETDFNPSSKIVFYPVWGTVTKPNYFEDITTVYQMKRKAFSLYKSRVSNNINIIDRMCGLNLFYGLFADVDYAEAYRVESILDYISRDDDKSWAFYK